MTPATKTKPPLSPIGMEAWKAFLGGHALLIRELDTELSEQHGATLGDFDVLAQLANAPDGSLRMCDLAAAVMLSPSGLSRRVDRLDRAGLVARQRGETDARSVEARLTTAGAEYLERLRDAHLAGVRERFAARFSDAELKLLGALLERLTR